MTMNSANYNPFDRAASPSWIAASLWALLVEAALMGWLVLDWFGGFRAGADNPLWFYFALILQFPASLLFVLFPRLFETGGASLVFVAVLVALLQILLITVLIRRPWRTQRGSSNQRLERP
jgi:hypothetical protein